MSGDNFETAASYSEIDTFEKETPFKIQYLQDEAFDEVDETSKGNDDLLEHEAPSLMVNEVLPSRGTGYYSIVNQNRQYGTATIISSLMKLGQEWFKLHPNGPKLGIGDISRFNGGELDPHKTHMRGLDVDIIPMRSESVEGPTSWKDKSYNQEMTRDLIKLLLNSNEVQIIFYNDPILVKERLVTYWPGHDNHMHIRFGGGRALESYEVKNYVSSSIFNEPIGLPLTKPVDFAPEPSGTAYWPLISKDKDWDVVSYRFGQNKGDVVQGRNTGREFLAPRYNKQLGERFHAAVDLYANAGDPVLACEDGTFLYKIDHFLGNTSAIYIEHSKVIVLYGEIKPKSWEIHKLLKKGDPVKAGQVIGEVGVTPGGSSMLHFETWDLGLKNIKNPLTGDFRSWKKGGEPPKHVLNPTKYLLYLKEKGLKKRSDNILSPPSKSSAPTYDTGSQQQSENKFLKLTLPTVLAGPIVRRATISSVWFWIALSKEIQGVSIRIIPYNERGQIHSALTSEGLKEIAVQPRLPIVIRLGQNIWMALCEAVPLPGKYFPTDTILGYDLRITTDEGDRTKLSNLSDLNLQIAYDPFPLPTFIIGKKNTTIVQGSCRRPGGPGEDAFGVFDKWMSKIAANAINRPASLILTGDQIYADDVAVPLFKAVHEIAADVFGYVEKIPDVEKAELVSVDKYSYKNSPDMKHDYAGDTKFDQFMRDKEWSGRRKLTHRKESKIGFTTEDGEAHLLSFPEYAAMYMTVWNTELCKLYRVDDGSNNRLKDYHNYVQAARRLMANCSTYMLCDDHEVTDDWNLDNIWRDKTKDNKMARRIIGNALTAYWCFQAWGNDPEMFNEHFRKFISERLESMRQKKGLPDITTERCDNWLYGWHWSFMTASNPKALCVDTRTRREYPPGKTAVLSGKEVWPFLEGLRIRYGFQKGDVLLLVLPTPFFPHRSMMKAQALTFKNRSKQRYEGEYELYGNNPEQRADLIDYIKNGYRDLAGFGPSAIVIFSGDVHHGSVIAGEYGYGSSPTSIWSGKADVKIPVLQITSSPIKNIKADAYIKKHWSGLYLTDAGNAGEDIVPQWERQAKSIKQGTYLGMRAQVVKPKGGLGRETYVYENHLCVVEMPEKPGGNVRFLFVGQKKGQLETAEGIVDLKDVFKNLSSTNIGDVIKAASPLARVIARVL